MGKAVPVGAVAHAIAGDERAVRVGRAATRNPAQGELVAQNVALENGASK